MIIFTKFHKDWTKNVDFLLLANFWMCLIFFTQTLYVKNAARGSKIEKRGNIVYKWSLRTSQHIHWDPQGELPMCTVWFHFSLNKSYKHLRSKWYVLFRIILKYIPPKADVAPMYFFIKHSSLIVWKHFLKCSNMTFAVV